MTGLPQFNKPIKVEAARPGRGAGEVMELLQLMNVSYLWSNMVRGAQVSREEGSGGEPDSITDTWNLDNQITGV